MVGNDRRGGTALKRRDYQVAGRFERPRIHCRQGGEFGGLDLSCQLDDFSPRAAGPSLLALRLRRMHEKRPSQDETRDSIRYQQSTEGTLKATRGVLRK